MADPMTISGPDCLGAGGGEGEGRAAVFVLHLLSVAGQNGRATESIRSTQLARSLPEICYLI